MYEANISILRCARLFDGIDVIDLKSLLNCLRPIIREYKKNEYIAFAGERFDSLGIIVRGNAAVIKEDVKGNRIIMALLKPGDMFGEMAAFSSRPIWLANVCTQETSTVYFIPSIRIISECNNVCPWHSMLIRNMLKILSEKALMLNQKVEYLSIKSMRGRICAFLLEQYKKTGQKTIILPMNRNELADYLNVSRPSMSREMGKMREEGIIDFYMATVKILDLEALKI